VFEKEDSVMNSRMDQIMYYVSQLGIRVAEEDLISDLDEISDEISDAFWDEMYRNDAFELAVGNVDDMLDDELEELPYIADRRENEESWDESDDYDAFRELIKEEVFERADIPEDEADAEERMEENIDESENGFNEDENS
jgi:hypothetical protein